MRTRNQGVHTRTAPAPTYPWASPFVLNICAFAINQQSVRGKLWLRSDVSIIPCFLSHNSWMRKKVCVKMFSVRPQILSSVAKPGAGDTYIFRRWWLGVGCSRPRWWLGVGWRSHPWCPGVWRWAPTPGIAWEGYKWGIGRSLFTLFSHFGVIVFSVIVFSLINWYRD